MKENIEEDIEILENLQKDFINLVSKKFVMEEDKRRAEITAIEHILFDYKRVLKENEELKKELGRVTNGRNQLFEYATAQQSNPEMLHKILRVEYISKQKIQDKIEELENKSGGNVFHIQQTINAEIRLLQDLLESEEK